MSTETPIEDGSWYVWGDEVDPLLTDATKEAAEAKLAELKAAGRTDVFAEDNETGETFD